MIQLDPRFYSNSQAPESSSLQFYSREQFASLIEYSDFRLNSYLTDYVTNKFFKKTVVPTI